MSCAECWCTAFVHILFVLVRMATFETRLMMTIHKIYVAIWVFIALWHIYDIISSVVLQRRMSCLPHERAESVRAIPLLQLHKNNILCYPALAHKIFQQFSKCLAVTIFRFYYVAFHLTHTQAAGMTIDDLYFWALSNDANDLTPCTNTKSHKHGKCFSLKWRISI